LTSALDGGEWSASQPGHFTLRVRAPLAYWDRRLGGPRASLDAVAKKTHEGRKEGRKEGNS